VSRWAGYALRLVVSVAIIALLFRVVDAPALMARLAAMDLVWIAVAVVCLTFATALMALRWQITSRKLGVSFGFGWALREYYLAQLVNLFLPGGVLGDAGRALRSPRSGGGFENAAHAVMIERLAGQVAIVAIGLVGGVYAVLHGGIEFPSWMATPLLWGGVVLAAVIGLVAVVSRKAHVVARFGRSFRQAFLARDIVGWQLGLSLLTSLLLIGGFVACARATGTRLPFEATLTVVPLILTAMMIPLSVGGWGLREGAAAALFPVIGATAGAGVAAGAAYGGAMIIAALPGLVFIPFLRRQSEPA